MITVTIQKGNQELALIRISNTLVAEIDGESTYLAEFVVDRINAVGVIRKSFRHNRLERNVLSLLKEALATLEPHNLEFEDGPASPSDLARRFSRLGAAFQGWAGQLRNH